MPAWTDDELRRIDSSLELEIAPVRRDGSLRTRTPIWAVRVGDDLYVRAAHGPSTGWHRVARRSGAARVWAGGVEKAVTVEPAHESVHDDVDAAYREKYSRYASIVDGITNDETRATTMRFTPR